MEFFEIVKDYIVIGVIIICLIFGFILKNLVKTDKINPFIPLIMAALGVTLNVWFSGWVFSPTVLIGGLVSGLASSGAYDGYKAIKEYFGNVITNIMNFMKNGSANDTDELNE